MSDDDIPIDDLIDALDDDEFGWGDDDLADRDGGGEILGVRVVNWRDLVDDDAAEVWQDLFEWVSWLIRRYSIPMNKLPLCWPLHGALVEELSALHTAWLVSFDATDGGLGPIGWHERFHAMRDRLQYNGGCQTKHLDDRAREVAAPANWDDWTRRSRAH